MSSFKRNLKILSVSEIVICFTVPVAQPIAMADTLRPNTVPVCKQINTVQLYSYVWTNR